MTSELSGKTCLVTGANSGIGFFTALGLAKLGAEVVMVSRDGVKGQAAAEAVHAETGNEKISLLVADFSSFKAVRRLAGDFMAKHKNLHVHVNNAGAINGRRIMTPDGYETTFQVNHLSPFLLTNLLLPVIKQSAPARIVNVASMAHYMGHMDFEDLMGQKKYNDMKAYAQSKLANVLFTKHLAELIEGSGVVTNSLHPGVVHTGFSKDGSPLAHFFYKTFGFLMDTPEKGARTSMHVAVSKETAVVSGRYFSECREKTPSAEARNAEIAEKLWDISLKLTGLDR